MSDETPAEANAPKPFTDDFVVANWGVAVLPGESISIHYEVSPKDEKDCITSVSASVVEEVDGMVVHSFLGSTASDLRMPKPGQGMVGDTGADGAVFSGRKIEGDLKAILAGTVKHGEDTFNFFFHRPVDLSQVDQPPADEEE